MPQKRKAEQLNADTSETAPDASSSEEINTSEGPSGVPNKKGKSEKKPKASANQPKDHTTWTKREEDLLLSLIEKHGTKWTKVTEELNQKLGKTTKQVK
ncbi:hypothetical protein HDV00_004746 [Rhizophlyctis rosea]|nr:hypothetical protein HDV00_004746 [Rhizophlyctis rosea]